MNRETVRQRLDENLSGLYVTERKHRMMMREITTGGKTVKKKISWSLVLACVLILALAGAAYAMISWRQMAETTAQLESQVGYFETWDAEQKAELLQQLVACGKIENSEKVQKALAEASAQHNDTQVTSLLENWMELPEDAITLMSIMETILGKFESWPVEDKAWYSEVLIKTGRMGYDEEIHMLPTSEDLQQEEVLSIAQNALIEHFQLSPAALDDYAVDFDFYVMPGRENDKRWLVSFRPPLAEGDGAHSVIAEYILCVTNQGEVTADDLRGIEIPWEKITPTPAPGEGINGYRTSEEIKAAKGESKNWTLEERAYFISWYGLPDENQISEEEAVALAESALKKAYPDLERDIYTRYDFFIIDSNDRDVPYWYIVFSRDDEQGSSQGMIEVYIDGNDGHIDQIVGEGEGNG